MATKKEVKKTIYTGPFVHCKSLQELDICTVGAIGVDEQGKIAYICREEGKLFPDSHTDWKGAKVVRIRDNGFYFPGFIDTHIHAPQYPNAGIFGKSTLLDWLNTYTFPMEGSLSDLAKARRIYNRVVSRTLSHGTTCASYYATIHVPATNLLADICLERGQRGFIGRVCMDTMSPDFYRDESPEKAIEDTKATVDHIKSIDPDFDVVTPIITPRFAPSCTAHCLKGLGDLQKETQLPVQTHISENKNEIKLVAELFPDSPHYTGVYDQAGLLTNKTILAHAVHLTSEEKTLVKQRESKISHCPASNTALTSGCAPVRDLLDRGISVGLGTDVSGGYSPSVLEMVRQAILVSRHVAMTEGDAAKLSTEEALYLATKGGAEVVGLGHKVGAFEVGLEWDAQMIGLGGVGDKGEREGEGALLPVDVFGWETWEERVAKWVYGGDDRNVRAVWVKGRLVHQSTEI